MDVKNLKREISLFEIYLQTERSFIRFLSIKKNDELSPIKDIYSLKTSSLE